MPSRKQFEYMDLSLPMSIKKLDMYEMLEDRYKLIRKLLKTIDELKGDKYYIAIVEVPYDDGTHYGIWVNDKGNFMIFDPEKDTKKEYEPMEFFNWVFMKAPYMSVVGKGSHVEDI